MNFGLNLFSIRSLIQTEEEFLATAIKLKEMGYSYMQFSGCPYDADKIARVTRASDMPVVLTHVPMDRIIGDTDALMEEHDKFGCKNIGLGAMGAQTILDERLCFETIDKLNLAAEKMKKNGFEFFYHNHNHEFYKHGDVTVFDYMIANAPHINFTLDTYWVQYGGASIIEYVERLNGRIKCVHLKDHKTVAEFDSEKQKYTLKPIFAPVGDGTINFKDVIAKMKQSGAEYFLVEQDNAANFDDPLEQVGRSIKYLKGEF